MSGLRSRTHLVVSADDEVQQCFAAVQVPGIQTQDLAIDVLCAMTDWAEPAAREALRALCDRGVLTSPSPDWYRLVQATATPDPDAQMNSRQGRFFAYLMTALASAMDVLSIPSRRGEATYFEDSPSAIEWVVAYRGLLLRALQLGARAYRSDACWLATSLWLITPKVAALRDDETWTADLARHGEEAAIQGRDPHTLGTVLEHSADWARQHGDHRKAEAQWVRALAIWDRLPEHEPVARVLGALVDLYRAWGRFHRALDAGFDLVSQTQRGGDERSAALALHEVGVTMLAARRPDSAVDYLNQAHVAMGRLAEPVTADRAHTLVALGRAYWQLGKWTRARRQFSAALELWVDVDDVESDRVRQLLRQPPRGPLP